MFGKTFIYVESTLVGKYYIFASWKNYYLLFYLFIVLQYYTGNELQITIFTTYMPLGLIRITAYL